MGDRANVIIKGSDNAGGDLVLYVHYSGYRVEQMLADGMRAAERAGRLQGDQPYGQRSIVQSVLVSVGEADGLGAGLWVGQPSEPHVVVFDYDDQTVEYDPTGAEYGAPRKTVPVAEFLAAYPAKVEQDA